MEQPTKLTFFEKVMSTIAIIISVSMIFAVLFIVIAGHP